MARQKPPRKTSNPAGGERPAVEAVASPPRIVGGGMRGRKLLYSGDLRTRPMKERVREAVFNLVGPAVKGKTAIDLFAGTGALGLEAISRGAGRAVFIERHYPTLQLIRRNVEALGVTPQCELVFSNTFAWARQPTGLGSLPWVVFCSPPFDFYVQRSDEMLLLIGNLMAAAPSESIFVVEADARFDFARLPQADQWDVRTYPPAVIGIYRRISE
jgi:16S rRNA (guanine966-N2)-methyltransferase